MMLFFAVGQGRETKRIGACKSLIVDRDEQRRSVDLEGEGAGD